MTPAPVAEINPTAPEMLTVSSPYQTPMNLCQLMVAKDESSLYSPNVWFIITFYNFFCIISFVMNFLKYIFFS